MNEKYSDWNNNSQNWRDELERALEKYGANDVVTQYTNVAFAFPSNEPNPHFFDYPLIDQERFIHWAESNGWKVQMAPEMASDESKHSPPVRFTKK